MLCRGNIRCAEMRFGELIQSVEDFVFGEDEEVVMSRALDIDKTVRAGVEFVEFFAIPGGDDGVLVTMNDEEGRVDGADAFDVWILISQKEGDTGDGAKGGGQGGDEH